MREGSLWINAFCLRSLKELPLNGSELLLDPPESKYKRFGMNFPAKVSRLSQ